jgi:hypothetical protein
VTAGAGGEARRAVHRSRCAQRLDAQAALLLQRLVERQVPLRVDRRPVVAEADLGERGELGGERDRGVAGRPGRYHAVREPEPERLVGPDGTTGEDQVERRALADDPGQAHGAAVDQRHTPAAAEHTEHRGLGRHPQVAPQRELQPARDRVTLDRGDDRLRQLHARRSERTVAVGREVVDTFSVRVGHRLEVGAGAEDAVGTREHRGGEPVVGVEARERVGQRGRGRPIDRVADVGPVDGPDRDRADDFVVHRHARSPRAGVSRR